MTEILMPRLSDSMEEGTIIRWLIADGEAVAIGAELVEIETDKATMSYESEVEGTLQVLAPQGETVRVGQVIAQVGEAVVLPPRPAVDHAVAEPQLAPAAGGNGDRADARAGVLATPVARRLAAVHGVALADISGTGPRGRITKSDVAQAAGIEPPAPQQSPAEPAPTARAPTTAAPPDGAPAHSDGGAKGSTTVEELSRLQQTIARRMAQAKATVPHFQVQTDVIMDEAIALRRQLKSFATSDTAAPSFNDLIVKGCAIALRGHPRVNGSYEDGRFELHARVNIGVAVATQDALIVPTLFDADTKSLGTIASESRTLAERVRSGAITPPELGGGTFTVSNLGMYGMTVITPVINPPQAAILGVGAMRAVLARVDGEIVDRTLMTLTLSCDHRILYGADAAQFLGDVKALLEAPMRILL